ncbi:MAG: hypothetical protein V1729_06280 [Candidatus Woesearchaeota archaeon]
MARVTLIMLMIIVLASSVSGGQFFLKQILLEGESREYVVGDYIYNVTLVAVFDDSQKAQFDVNGELTSALGPDDSYSLSDGAVIQARSVMPQDAGDGDDLVQFNLFPVSHPEAEVIPAVSASDASAPIVPTVQETDSREQADGLIPVDYVLSSGRRDAG